MDFPAPMPPQRPTTFTRTVGLSDGRGDKAVVAVEAPVEDLAPAGVRLGEKHERLVALVQQHLSLVQGQVIQDQGCRMYGRPGPTRKGLAVHAGNHAQPGVTVAVHHPVDAVVGVQV